MMNRERAIFLERNAEEKLTEDEIKDGWFFCCDWDGMLVNKDSPEAGCCSCLVEGINENMG